MNNWNKINIPLNGKDIQFDNIDLEYIIELSYYVWTKHSVLNSKFNDFLNNSESELLNKNIEYDYLIFTQFIYYLYIKIQNKAIDSGMWFWLNDIYNNVNDYEYVYFIFWQFLTDLINSKK